MRFAYNTNGLSNHRLDDALELVAEAGYRGVALTLDHHHLDPFAPNLAGRARGVARQLRRLGLGLVVETGARFLLDPRHKHEPTLVSPDADRRARRLEFLRRAVDVAAVCEAEAVSFWAGTPAAEVDENEAWNWLADGAAEVCEYAGAAGVAAAFEPEPGMLVETLDDYRRLRTAVSERSDTPLRLALDTGHCLVTQDRTPDQAILDQAADLAAVTIEDMKRGEHRHLPFGEGDMDLRAVAGALREVRWQGLVCVELSRDSHRGVEMLQRSIDWLHQHFDLD